MYSRTDARTHTHTRTDTHRHTRMLTDIFVRVRACVRVSAADFPILTKELQGLQGRSS